MQVVRPPWREKHSSPPPPPQGSSSSCSAPAAHRRREATASGLQEIDEAGGALRQLTPHIGGRRRGPSRPRLRRTVAPSTVPRSAARRQSEYQGCSAALAARVWRIRAVAERTAPASPAVRRDRAGPHVGHQMPASLEVSPPRRAAVRMMPPRGRCRESAPQSPLGSPVRRPGELPPPRLVASLLTAPAESRRRRNRSAGARAPWGCWWCVQHLPAGDRSRQADAPPRGRPPDRRPAAEGRLRGPLPDRFEASGSPEGGGGAPRPAGSPPRPPRQPSGGAAHVDADVQAPHFAFRLRRSARRSTRWARLHGQR